MPPWVPWGRARRDSRTGVVLPGQDAQLGARNMIILRTLPQAGALRPVRGPGRYDSPAGSRCHTDYVGHGDPAATYRFVPPSLPCFLDPLVPWPLRPFPARRLYESQSRLPFSSLCIMEFLAAFRFPTASRAFFGRRTGCWHSWKQRTDPHGGRYALRVLRARSLAPGVRIRPTTKARDKTPKPSGSSGVPTPFHFVSRAARCVI